MTIENPNGARPASAHAETAKAMNSNPNRRALIRDGVVLSMASIARVELMETLVSLFQDGFTVSPAGFSSHRRRRRDRHEVAPLLLTGAYPE